MTDLRHVVFLVWTEVSVCNSTFKLVRQMMEAGISVTYVTTEEWRAFVEKQRFCTYVVSTIHIPKRLPNFRSCLNRGAIASRVLDDLRIGIDDAWLQSIDLVLLQSTRWYWSLIFHESSARVVAITSNLGSIRRSGLPPIYSPIKPTQKSNMLWRICSNLAWFSLRWFGSFRHYNRGIELPASNTCFSVVLTLKGSLFHLFKILLEKYRSPTLPQLVKQARKANIIMGTGD